MTPRIWCTIFLLGVSGCSGKPSRVNPPDIDAEQSGKDAVAAYDKNGNGVVDEGELDAVPAFKAAMKQIDKNSDGQVSAAEVTDRINAWKEGKVGITSLMVRVNLDGKPLEGATIEFIPEPFLGPAVKPAKGTTGQGGAASCIIDDPELAKERITGAQCGFYKVTITGGGGKTIPSKYNTDTTLGAEIAQDADWAQSGLEFNLKSR
jgi:hypothetical protein